jgi:hypothetical protein
MYKIYAGLHNATLACVENFATKAEAEQYAYHLACDEYDLQFARDFDKLRDIFPYNKALEIYRQHQKEVIDYYVV